MSTVDTAGRVSVKTSAWILLARHTLLIVALLAIYALMARRVDGFLISWIGAAAFVFGLAAAIAGLAWLFFTDKEKGKAATTFQNAAWVIACLMLLDPLLQRLNMPESVSAPLQVEALAEPAAAARLDGTVAPDPRFDQAMQVAVDAIITSAKAAGTFDYSKDAKAAEQFDVIMAELRVEPSNASKTAAELAGAAHLAVLARRGTPAKVTEHMPVAAAQRSGDRPGCPNRPGENSETRSVRLADARERYPFLAERDDMAVVRAIHRAFYDDLPLGCVADALGVVMPEVNGRPKGP